jgi:hypothetical protein
MRQAVVPGAVVRHAAAQLIASSASQMTERPLRSCFLASIKFTGLLPGVVVNPSLEDCTASFG